MITALSAPQLPKEKTYAELISILEQHLAPKKNILVAQHQFLSKYQTENQSISEFVATLRADSGDCNFISDCSCKISIADIFLRAQFIRGIKDNSIRENILQSEIKTFEDIVSKAIVLETSKINSKELAQRTMQSTSTADINKINNSLKNNDRNYKRKGRNQLQFNSSCNQSNSRKRELKIDYVQLGIDGLCFRCGKRNHLSRECKINKSNLKCTGCQKIGHVAKVCIRSLLDRKSKSTINSTNFVKDVKEYGSFQIIDLYQNRYAGEDFERYRIQLNIEGKPINFEIDSGSGYTFLPRDKFADLKLDIPLQPCTVGFRSYTKNVFVPDGKIKVNIDYNGKIFQDDIYIVPEEFDAILGRVWIRRLGINLNEIDQQKQTTTLTRTIYSIKDNIDEIISNYSDIFQERVGCIPDFQVALKLRENVIPIFHREREIPFAFFSRVEQELDLLEKEGIITKTETSDWGSPLVVVPKADGGVRLCVDYKIGVNERLMDAHYPIQKIDEILNSLHDSRYFCRLDLFKAYLHVQVDEKSSQIQTILTHRGTYRVNRLSFGIKTAPSEFNRIIDQILRGVPKTEKYFDDIIVHGATKEECEENLRTCLNRLRKFDLHLNRRKCVFFQQCIDILGYTIKYNKITKSPEKVKAITNMPRPKSSAEIKTFLGMVTFYSRFIPNASTITAPLRYLLKEHVIFRWTTKCETAFIRLKQEIASDRVVIPFNSDLPVQLAFDASPTGVGAVLSHIIDGHERPIAFASRSLTQAEQNYSQLDREALAIIFGTDRFFQYLFGRRFQLITDNQPLSRIFHQYAKIPRMASARLQRYATFLSGFDYKVVYKKGSENLNADCLSRAALRSYSFHTDEMINEEVHLICKKTVSRIYTPKITFQSIQQETQKDDNLSKILRELLEKETSELNFTTDNGIIFRGQRVVVPSALQAAVLDELHRTHIGISKMKQLARRYVYWKQIDKDIEHLIRSCSACANIKSSPPKAPLHPWEEPQENWQRIHIDYAGPYQGYYFLVIVDAKSKWTEIEICSSTPSSTSTIELLQDTFSKHGFPEVMVLDNATIFTSEEFQQFCKKTGIFCKFIAPGHPATNGLAERNVQTLKKRLASMINEPQSMRKKVREILFRYRATPLSNQKTPAEQYLHQNFRIQLDALKPIKFQSSRIQPKTPRQLRVGERVQARYYTANKNKWKLGTVIRKFGYLHYLVKLDDGYIFKRHIDQLRSIDILPPESQPRKTITFAPEFQEQRQNPEMGDLVNIPLNISQQTQEHHLNESMDINGGAPVSEESQVAKQILRRSKRIKQIPKHLRDFQTKLSK